MSVTPDELSGGEWSLHLEALEAEVYLNVGEPEGKELIDRRKEVVGALDRKAASQYRDQNVSVVGTHKRTGPGQRKPQSEDEVEDDGGVAIIGTGSNIIDMWLHQGKTSGEANGFTVIDLDEDLRFVDESDEEQSSRLETIKENALGRHAIAHLVITDASGNTSLSPNDYSFVAPVVFNAVAPVTSNFLFIENQPADLVVEQRRAEILKIFQFWTPRNTALRKRVERDIRKSADGLSTLVEEITKIKELSRDTTPQDLAALIEWLELMFADHFFDRHYNLEGNVPTSLVLDGETKWQDFNPDATYNALINGFMVAPRDKEKSTEPSKGDAQVCVRMLFRSSDGGYIPVAVPIEDLSATKISRIAKE